jgi:hypothetical protein
VWHGTPFGRFDAVTPARQQQRAANGNGVFLLILGAAAVFLALRYLDWYAVPQRGPDSSGNITFASLHTSADQLGGAGIATAYFDWLAWALLIGAFVVGWLANLAWPPADALRVLAFLLGFLGVVATFYALLQHAHATGSTRSVVYHGTWGLWTAVAGYAVLAVGGVLGPITDRKR